MDNKPKQELTPLILEWLSSKYNVKFTVTDEYSFDRIGFRDRAIIHVCETHVWLFDYYENTLIMRKAYERVEATNPEFFNKIDEAVHGHLVVWNLAFPKRLLPQEIYGPI